MQQKPKEAARLGEVIEQLMGNRVSPLQARFGSITEVWSQLLPFELRQHCRIVDISGGQLKVITDSPSYANELRWCSSELLEELARRCPRAKIKKIKFITG